MYVVINPDGTLHVCDGPATAAAVNSKVGPPGFGMFPLNSPPRAYAFVNDEGLVPGKELPLNVVGGALCAAMTGVARTLAGPVVITGWNRHAAGPEITDLNSVQADLVRDLHDNVQRALAGEVFGLVGVKGWSDTIRRYSAAVRAR